MKYLKTFVLFLCRISKNYYAKKAKIEIGDGSGEPNKYFLKLEKVKGLEERAKAL